MWLTRLCVQRPTIVFVMLALIAVVAGIGIATIRQQQFPNVDFPVVSVRASYPGGSTTEIRDSIVRPIEDAIAGAPNLLFINTSVQQGQASITAQFDLSSNKTTDLVQVQRRVMVAQSQLPSDMPAPTIGSFDPSQANVLDIGLSSRALSPGALSAIVTNNIVPAIEQINGVSNVSAGGTVTPAYEVLVDPNRMTSAGLTLNDVISTIQSNNNREPGGIAYLPGHETTIDVRGDLTTQQSVANLLISAASPYTSSFGNASYSEPAVPGAPGAPPSGAGSAINPWTVAPRELHVSDIAAVDDSYEPQRTYSYIDTQQTVSLGVQKATGASEVVAASNVLKALPAIEKQYPQIHFAILNNQAAFTEDQIFGVVRTLIEAMIITAIVMLFFLRSWRNAI